MEALPENTESTALQAEPPPHDSEPVECAESSTPPSFESLMEMPWSAAWPLIAEIETEGLLEMAQRFQDFGQPERVLGVLYHLIERDDWPCESLAMHFCALLNTAESYPELGAITEKFISLFPSNSVFQIYFATANLALGRLEGVRRLGERLALHDPFNSAAWKILALYFEKRGRFVEATQCQARSLELYDRHWQDFVDQGYLLARAELVDQLAAFIYSQGDKLEKMGHLANLQRQLTALYEKNKRSSRPPRSTPVSAETIHFYEIRNIPLKILTTAAALMDANSNDIWNWIRLANALSINGDNERAINLLQLARERFPDKKALIAGMLARVYASSGRHEYAEQVLHAEGAAALRDLHTVSWLWSLYRETGRSAKAHKLLLDLKQSPPKSLIAERLELLLAESEFALGNRQSAVARLGALAESLGEATFEAQHPIPASWLAKECGKMEEARDIFDRGVGTNGFRGLLPSTPPVEVKPAATEIAEGNQIVLVTVVKDERLRLPTFLQHYRRLGVEVFYVIDNNSTDDTREYLLGQEDVRLFHTAESYAASGFGLAWAQHVISSYVGERWYLLVDVDELLVFPHSDTVPLQLLTAYMERSNHDALFAFMLDLYPERLGDSAGWDGNILPYSVCPYFDPTHQFLAQFISPYVKVRGGFRARVFGDGSGPGGVLEKVVLMKGQSGTYFYEAAHLTSPAVISDVTSVLLHFKFIGDFREAMSAHVSAREHVNSAAQYRQYLEWCQGLSPDSLLTIESSQRYHCPEQLLELGLIETSPRFEDFVAAQHSHALTLSPKLFLISHPGCDLKCLLNTLSAAGYSAYAGLIDSLYARTGLARTLSECQVVSAPESPAEHSALLEALPNAAFVYLRTDGTRIIADSRSFALEHFHTDDIKVLTSDQLTNSDNAELRFIQSFLNGHSSWEEAADAYLEQACLLAVRTGDERMLSIYPEEIGSDHFFAFLQNRRAAGLVDQLELDLALIERSSK